MIISPEQYDTLLEYVDKEEIDRYVVSRNESTVVLDFSLGELAVEWCRGEAVRTSKGEVLTMSEEDQYRMFIERPDGSSKFLCLVSSFVLPPQWR